MSQVAVWITNHDIKCGTPCDPGACAVALAMRRAMPGVDVQVLSDRTVLRRSGREYVVWHDASARGLIQDIDEGMTVGLVSLMGFHFDAPAWAMEKAGEVGDAR